MKKILFLLVAISLTLGNISAENNDPVLMKINGKPVTKSEFEYLYHKNNTSTQQSLDEYLKLFTDYKLKVEEAINLGFDAAPEFVNEFNGYKNQVTAPYLTDTIYEHIVAKQLYDRMSENIETSHILVKFPQGVIFPKDTLEAYNKALFIREQLTGPSARTFEDVAAEFSEDPSAKRAEKAGYLGWGNAMMFVAPFENGMYATKTGEVSMPVRSMFGYHLIKVHNRRADRGKVNVSHIMLSFPQRNPNQHEVDSVYKVAKEVHGKLVAGEDYNQVCEQYSTDQMTSSKGGSMGWLRAGIGIPEEFLETAFALEKEGDISEPVKTAFGYHIIRLDGKGERDSWEDMKEQILRHVRNSDWSETVKTMEAQKWASESTYQLEPATYQKIINLASEYSPVDTTFTKEIAQMNDILLIVNGKGIQGNELGAFLPKGMTTRNNVSTDVVEKSINNLVAAKLKEAYAESLNDKYPEYRNLLKEYHDGILLFNIMNAEIWEKAANDTTGLQDYFKKNKSKYKWDNPRYKGYIVYCKDEATLAEAQRLAATQTDDLGKFITSSLNTDSTKVVFTRKGTWAKGENKFIDSDIFNVEEKPDTLADYPYHFVKGKLIESPEEYLDIRGLVISDLQEQREKEWMKHLRKKYRVEVDKKVLQTLR